MAGVEAFSGFLCPACPGHVKLDTQEQLVEHWRTLHDDAGAVPPSKPHVPKVGDATLVQYLTPARITNGKRLPLPSLVCAVSALQWCGTMGISAKVSSTNPRRA